MEKEQLGSTPVVLLTVTNNYPLLISYTIMISQPAHVVGAILPPLGMKLNEMQFNYYITFAWP